MLMLRFVLAATLSYSLFERRFFPAVYYLSTSKIAIAVLGNLAFAMALTLYNLTTKVKFHAVELSAKQGYHIHVVCPDFPGKLERVRGGEDK